MQRLGSKGFSAALACFVLFVLHSSGYAQQTESQLRQFEYSGPAMGVQLNIVVFAIDDKAANTAIEAAVARVEELEQILSNYRDDSEVNQLSGKLAEGPVSVSDDLWAILNRAHEISESTDGLFDVTLAPLTDLWRDARQSGQLPEASAIESARSQTGYQHIEFDEASQSISSAVALRFDFGAIGKGYAADQALGALEQNGCRRALVDLGGDLAVGESPPDKSGWRVQIAPVAWDDDVKKRFTQVKRCGVATSGHAHQFVEIDGVRYSHILDPRTGLGITRQASVTVVSDDATSADAVASAFSVLDRNAAMIRVASMPGKGLLIQEEASKDVSYRVTSGAFPEIMTVDND